MNGKKNAGADNKQVIEFVLNLNVPSKSAVLIKQ